MQKPAEYFPYLDKLNYLHIMDMSLDEAEFFLEARFLISPAEAHGILREWLEWIRFEGD